jgi:hypothetical protein
MPTSGGRQRRACRQVFAVCASLTAPRRAHAVGRGETAREQISTGTGQGAVTACQHLPALRARPLCQQLATARGQRRHDYRAVCRRLHRGAVADDARARGVGLRHSSCEAGEQSGAIRCGASGARGGDHGECGSAKHAPDSEPHKRVKGAGSHTANRCRR